MNKLFKASFKRYCTIGLVLLFFLTFFNFSAVSESEERPDLKITYVDFPEEVSEDENVKFVIKVENSVNDETGEYGNISFGDRIWVSLKVDGVLVSTNYSDSGIDVGDSIYINISWDAHLALASERQILIEVDYLQHIAESNENNNDRPGVIYVYEKDTELKIMDVSIPDIILVNNSYKISAAVKNFGSETSEDVILFLNSSVNDLIKKIVYEDIIYRDELIIFDFNWTPKELGKHIIDIDVFYSGENHDSYSKSVFVGKLDWWNESWHYRYFLSVTGEGNFSKTFNFTSILNDLEVSTGSFENDTLRVVKYSSDGQIENDSVHYNWNETEDYNEFSNVQGELLWKVEGQETEKFFCVYFDVSLNPGFRSYYPEDELINVSGNVSINDTGFSEGWGFEIVEPSEGMYSFSGDSVDILVETDSFAENVEVFVFLNENESKNRTLSLESLDGLSWSNSTILDEMGNWTFRIKCTDSAGFETFEKETTVFVGKPDLLFSDISFKTSWSTTSPKVYVNDAVYFTAKVFCYFATVAPTNVKMSVYNDEDVEIYSDVGSYTFEKDEYANVSFQWSANLGGNFSFEFYVDYDDAVDESNESNNKGDVDIQVYYWPDLIITDIDWKETTIMEYDKVKFKVKVKNIGLGDANNYPLKLFIKPSSQKTIEYEDEVYTQKVSINAGSEKEFYLFWNSSEPGIWYIAAKVFVSDEKQDSNTSNNGLFILDELVVKPTERNKPVIENVYTNPLSQQQGGSVDIIADVTDDTGLKSVFVSIYDSSGSLIETGDMIRLAGKGFKYVFEGTLKRDTYDFIITAVDISINENNETYNDSFNVIRDQTSPIISYIYADPIVQLIGESTLVSCTVVDNIVVDSVEIMITNLSGNTYNFEMDKTSGKYVYENIYNESGNYSYYITAMDRADNIKLSKKQYFYITSNLNDSDNDKIPDWWEERYGLNPFDSTDSNEDYDNDGVVNFEEYLGDTHPRKDIMLQNVAYRVRSNVLYIALSISMFVLILLLNFVVRKRR